MEGALGHFVEHDLHHLLADDLLLGVLGVTGGCNLLLVSTGESNAEHSEEIAVGGLGLYEGLDECVPLLDESAEFITGDVHSIEVGEAVESFHFFDLELDLSPGLLVVLVLQVSKTDLENASFERISSVF